MDNNTRHNPVGRRASDMLKWWPILVLIGGGLVTWGEMRYQVAQHEKDISALKDINAAQWERIGDLMSNLKGD